MPTIDEQFVEYIVKSLVSKPDAVSIKRTIDEKGVLLELTVDAEDLGRVIGKRGGTAQSIRSLLRALGTKNEARYNLKIVDVDGGQDRRGNDEGNSNDSNVDSQSASTAATVTNDDSADEKVDDSRAQEQPVEEPTDEPVEDLANTPETLTEKTRKELADLDDLDL